MQKGQSLIFLLIGILIIAAVGGAYYWSRSNVLKPSPTPVITSQTPQPTSAPSPTPDETVYTEASRSANWKTYTNNNLKISFKYPPDWFINFKDTRQTIKLCDLQLISSSLSPKVGIKFGACEASGITPTASITINELLDIRPESSKKESYYPNPAIQLFYYKNPESLSIQDFNNKYLSQTVAGDPVSIWATNYEKITNLNGINTYFDKEHYCVAKCQIYVWAGVNKIFILKNFPTNAANQNEVFQNILSTFKFL